MGIGLVKTKNSKQESMESDIFFFKTLMDIGLRLMTIKIEPTPKSKKTGI